MNDNDIAQLAAQLAINLATKEDVNGIKEDVNGIKEDVNGIKEDVNGIKEDIKRLDRKIDEINHKTDVILKYADGIEEVTEDHEKRIKKIESMPIIAHELKKTAN